jgi:DNA-binding XRE family transcriptional regulator
MKIKKVSKTQLRKASENSSAVIANWLRTNRLKADLSQAQLADLAGIDRKTVNRIENGHFSPNIDTMTRVAVVLGKKTPSIPLHI